MMTTKLHPTAQGQAAVYRVASELILRGHAPYFPAVDHRGIDLIVDGHIRVQVKSTMRPTSHSRGPGRTRSESTIYFALSQTVIIKNQSRHVAAPRKWSDFCDVMILWAIEPNRFWIFPAHLVNNRHNITLDEHPKWKEFDEVVAKTMRANGASYQAIADHLGLNQSSLIRRRLTTHKVPKREMPSMEIRKYEGRWDLIAQYGAMLNEANKLVETPRESAVVIEA